LKGRKDTFRGELGKLGGGKKGKRRARLRFRVKGELWGFNEKGGGGKRKKRTFFEEPERTCFLADRKPRSLAQKKKVVATC